MSAALQARVDELAADLGRLRRRLEPGSSLAYLGERLAGQVETLDVMLRPSAGQLVSWTFPEDAETVEAAIEQVDRERARIRQLLGWKAMR